MFFLTKISWWKLRKNQGKLLGNQGKIREFDGIKKVGTLLLVMSSNAIFESRVRVKPKTNRAMACNTNTCISNRPLSGYASKGTHHWRIWRCGCITVPYVNPYSKIFMDFFGNMVKKLHSLPFKKFIVAVLSNLCHVFCIIKLRFDGCLKLHIIYVPGANNEA